MADAKKRKPLVRGRFNGDGPIAIIDIGSNSIRLVVYERYARAPTGLFNEKVLAGLGRGIGATGRLASETVTVALSALARFRRICDQCDVKELHVLATAAVRDASNGADFIEDVEDICRVPVRVLSGKDEARLSALGIISGIWKPNGVVGDLGGGSLELVEVTGTDIGRGQTLPLGGIRLQEDADGKPAKALKIADDMLANVGWLPESAGRDFYAVGGTWRSLGRLHLFQEGYPLHVMHEYDIATDEAIEFCQMVARRDIESIDSIETVSKARRPLLPYGAAVMEKVLRRMKPKRVVMSALGVREGLLFDLLPKKTQRLDPLVDAARELSELRSRSPDYAEELIDWTGQVFEKVGIDETDDEKRLRHASCLLSDIGWRAHPDYRGEQSLNIISNAGFVGVDHAGRAYLALAVYYRHQGLIDDALSPRIRELANSRLKERARILGAVLRVASVISASVEGILPNSSWDVDGDCAVLRLPGELAMLDGERLRKRVGQFGKLVGLKGIVLPLP
ncbi:Ppx/GppA family phosphatase [Stappia sp. F7233]|uniref:Ppx/GppA family phosphatase n=1 Tax=Stappia albiluteola TaxID=2758565 RepID=A0A839AAT6_9HYPH|nr:Ppx/GppA phosphatase family protein [Stappia albiluteola]MBA5776693.1 Ppx/GppA family phosphatase [Stappia albiluteola]